MSLRLTLAPFVLVFVACSQTPATLVADDSAAVFDTVDGAPSSTRTLQFTNGGGAETPMLSTQLNGDVAAFQIVDDKCNGQRLVAKQTCMVTVQLASSEPGQFAGELHVSGGPLLDSEVLLSGRVTAANLAITAPGGAAVDVLQGARGTLGTLTFDVQNLGGAPTGPLTIGDLTPFIVDGTCGGTSLAGGGHCQLFATFPPADLDATPERTTRTLTVAGTPGGSVSMDVFENVLSVGALTVSSVQLGPLATPSIAQMIKVTNASQVSSGAIGLAVVSDQAAVSATYDNTGDCGQGLAAGHSCQFVVTVTPNGQAKFSVTVTASAPFVHPGSGLITGGQ